MRITASSCAAVPKETAQIGLDPYLRAVHQDPDRYWVYAETFVGGCYRVEGMPYKWWRGRNWLLM